MCRQISAVRVITWAPKTRFPRPTREKGFDVGSIGVHTGFGNPTPLSTMATTIVGTIRPTACPRCRSARGRVLGIRPCLRLPGRSIREAVFGLAAIGTGFQEAGEESSRLPCARTVMVEVGPHAGMSWDLTPLAGSPAKLAADLAACANPGITHSDLLPAPNTLAGVEPALRYSRH